MQQILTALGIWQDGHMYVEVCSLSFDRLSIYNQMRAADFRLVYAQLNLSHFETLLSVFSSNFEIRRDMSQILFTIAHKARLSVLFFRIPAFLQGVLAMDAPPSSRTRQM
jgi:hypothetical protein